ncbi:cytochrome c [Telmatocola sphagniphila]|uniref:Cytochrome c n=1 Tax=Telmatocola sphagniphila TaxID=1123043 RepID=A0A8E6BA83_9BACT|nr:cytochrome c [Telmatocola sphagniphila]QVL33260.1 cytochrome c [Telmatocola sphagniphila]
MLRMILVILGLAAVIAAMLGARGQKTTNRPRHLFWDMKYQGKYYAQSQSRFFGDGRSARMPVSGTVAYSGADYFADAGYLKADNPDFLKEDENFYFGYKGMHEVTVIDETPKMGADGKPVLEGGKPVLVKKERKEMQPKWITNIPQRAIDELGGWDKLLARGKERYTINCSMCHGLSGYGGQGDTAAGIVGKYNMVGIASYHQDRLREMADGEIFNTITMGKNTMSPYGHMTKPIDRWAIVSYVRALQYSQIADKSLVPASQREQLGVPK